MEKKEDPKKVLKSLKEKIDSEKWELDYNNTSDIGYPEKDTYLSSNK